MQLSEIFSSNLRGKDYIRARNLSPEIVRLNNNICPHCLQLELLPAVQRIISSYKK